MSGTCCVCQDEMDMADYQDPRESTPSCYRLECGHSYHTKCIVQYMRNTQFDCIQCNVRRSPQEEIDLTGQIAQQMNLMKRDPEVRRLKKEADEAFREFKASRQDFQTALHAEVAELKEKSGYTANRKETLRRIAVLRAHIKAQCLRRNPLAAGVWVFGGDEVFDRLFFGRSETWTLRERSTYVQI